MDNHVPILPDGEQLSSERPGELDYPNVRAVNEWTIHIITSSQGLPEFDPHGALASLTEAEVWPH